MSPVREWVAGLAAAQEEVRDRSTVLDSSRDLRVGCDVRELDIERDTIPGELLELLERRR